MEFKRINVHYEPAIFTTVFVKLEQELAATSTLPDLKSGIKESWIQGEDDIQEIGGENSEWWDD